MPVYTVLVHRVDMLDRIEITYDEHIVMKSNIRGHDAEKNGSYE